MSTNVFPATHGTQTFPSCFLSNKLRKELEEKATVPTIELDLLTNDEQGKIFHVLTI
jgi:hypothetical protein